MYRQHDGYAYYEERQRAFRCPGGGGGAYRQGSAGSRLARHMGLCRVGKQPCGRYITRSKGSADGHREGVGLAKGSAGGGLRALSAPPFRQWGYKLSLPYKGKALRLPDVSLSDAYQGQGVFELGSR
ncbi:hypothetical protein DQ04_18241000 [Trypanosoma grayi]|uniref:hypothetical protein n=1 Tax=Trypanosoma grayi TaxID=71804 RepID=UPI0004F45EE4|nr:hypothetical protein DQ04_18241000 [Trypanosoma grayi]KEG05809.1 hypothetical protein DQ04_18241000 [Trypanosoma grayi]